MGESLPVTSLAYHLRSFFFLSHIILDQMSPININFMSVYHELVWSGSITGDKSWISTVRYSFRSIGFWISFEMKFDDLSKWIRKHPLYQQECKSRRKLYLKRYHSCIIYQRKYFYPYLTSCSIILASWAFMGIFQIISRSGYILTSGLAFKDCKYSLSNLGVGLVPSTFTWIISEFALITLKFLPAYHNELNQCLTKLMPPSSSPARVSSRDLNSTAILFLKASYLPSKIFIQSQKYFGKLSLFKIEKVILSLK